MPVEQAVQDQSRDGERVVDEPAVHVAQAGQRGEVAGGAVASAGAA